MLILFSVGVVTLLFEKWSPSGHFGRAQALNMKNRLGNTVEQNKKFFARQQKSGRYSEIKKLTSLQDAKVAKFLNSHVSGNILVVGGVWEFYQ